MRHPLLRSLPRWAPALLLSLLDLTACQQAPKKPNWMQESFAKSPQVLLANSAQFKDGQRLDGASAFLVEGADGRRYGVTAKHLLGPDGGIEPRKLPATLNAEVASWKLFARAGSADTVALGPLVNAADASDILLFGLAQDRPAYRALAPRFDAPSKGETVYLIGCPYAEAGCKQNRYPVAVAETSATEYLLQENKEPDLAGFSGCPVVDKDGAVIGLLTGSAKFEDGTVYTVVTPMKVVKSYLKASR